MNYRSISKLLGYLLLLLSMAQVSCLVFAVWDGEAGTKGLDGVEAFATSIGVCIIAALLLIGVFGTTPRKGGIRTSSRWPQLRFETNSHQLFNDFFQIDGSRLFAEFIAPIEVDVLPSDRRNQLE